MSKIYLAVGCFFIMISTMAQSFKTNQFRYPDKLVAKKAPYQRNDAPLRSENRATYMSEGFESGSFPPANWSVQSGPNSTITVPAEQTWHQRSNPDGQGTVASVLYSNAIDRHDEWLISDSIALPANGLLRLEFQFNSSQHWHVDPNNNADIKCYISTTGNSIADLSLGAEVFWEEDPAIVDEWLTFTWYTYQLDISAFAGQTIYLGWHYDGQDGAQFNLDNISISDILPNDLTPDISWTQDINTDYSYYKFSYDELRPLGFSSIIRNNGAATQSNVGMHYEITNSFGAVVDQGTTAMTIPNISAGEKDTVFHTTAYTPPASAETYTITMWTFSDSSDHNLSNDTATLVLDVEPYVWARERGPIDGGITNIADGNGLPFLIGNTFLVTDTTMVYALDIGIGADAPANNIIFGQIHIWNGSTYDWLGQTKEHTIVDEDQSNILTLQWANNDSIQLLPGDDVLVLAGHYGGANDGSDDVEIATSGDALEGTVIGYDNVGTLFQLINPPTPVVRINSDYTLTLEEVIAENGTKLGQNIPNPSQTITAIPFEIKKASKIRLILHDMTGKEIMTLDQGTVATGTHQIELNTSALSEGLYHYSLQVNDYRITRKLIVMR